MMWTAIGPAPWVGCDDAERGERLLARPRRHLAELVATERGAPRRVLRFGDATFDLQRWFPRAEIRRATLPEAGEAPGWARWPDLVWCDHALAGAPPDRVAWLRAHLAPDTLVAVADAHDALTPSGRRWLADELGLVPDPGVRRALGRVLCPLHWSLLGVESRWLALTWLGRVPAGTGLPD